MLLTPGTWPRLTLDIEPAIKRAVFLVVAMPLFGCGARSHSDDKHKDRHIDQQLQALLAGTEDRRFDFGTIVGRRIQRLPHTYRVVNRLPTRVRVVRSINAKPCCGEVAQLLPRDLAPGQDMPFTVTIRNGESAGPLQHRALVEIEVPHFENIFLEYWTLANVLPPARIEETSHDRKPLFQGRSSKRDFTAYLYGTVVDPPARLNDGTLKTKTPVEWAGSESERRLDGDVVERSRSFSLRMTAEGEPGIRQEELELIDEHDVLLHYPIQWEISTAIKASPSGVFLSSSDAVDKKIILLSQDSEAFEILEATSTMRGIKAQAITHGLSSNHILQLEARTKPPDRHAD